MNILVVGGGGREHALVWKLAQSAEKPELYCVPGSDAIAKLARTEAIRLDQTPHIAKYAVEKKIDLVVIGPEQPLVEGFADRLADAGVPVIGPSKAAARIEGSKIFMKEVCAKAGVRTADYTVLESKGAALAYIRRRPFPQVLKVDGLAAGKGVFVLEGIPDAWAALGAIFDQKEFGEAGRRIIVEDFVAGEEASFIVLTDGEHCVPLPMAQDHKRLLDGDQGPNTGGMGAYVPAPVLTPERQREAIEQVVRPVLRTLAEMGCPYRGFLYAGLMVLPDGLSVLEFNARPGDPETQPQLVAMTGDLLPYLSDLAVGRLKDSADPLECRSAACVVLASKGYPSNPEKGKRISGLDSEESNPEVVVFHAGTKKSGDDWVTNGGRVLGVTARADTHQEALRNAYDRVERISFDGMYFRRDIGHHALGPSRKGALDSPRGGRLGGPAVRAGKPAPT